MNLGAIISRFILLVTVFSALCACQQVPKTNSPETIAPNATFTSEPTPELATGPTSTNEVLVTEIEPSKTPAPKTTAEIVASPMVEEPTVAAQESEKVGGFSAVDYGDEKADIQTEPENISEQEDKFFALVGDAGVAFMEKKYSLALDYNNQMVEIAQAMAIDDYLVIAYLFRGDTYAKLMDYEAAIADYENVNELSSGDAQTLNQLCWWYGLTEQPEEALPYCEEAVLLDRSVSYLDSRGLIYGLLGNFEAAIMDFEAVVLELENSTDPELSAMAAQRVEWITEMEAGENPFTADQMAVLREETSEQVESTSTPEPSNEPSADTAGSIQFTAEEMFELIMAKVVEVEPIILEEPDIQTVTIDIKRVPLPAEALTHHATVQYVYSLMFDDAGHLWANMTDGYVRWNVEAGTYEWDEAPEEIVTTLGGTSVLNCTEIAVEAGLEDAEYQFFPTCLPGTDENSYWFASYEDGIRYFDGENWAHYTTENGLISDEVSDLVIDSNGTLWASTFGGVAVYEDGSWSSIGIEDGLPEPFMTAIAIDQQENLWVGTRNYGVLQFDGVTWTTHDINTTGAVTDIMVDSAGGLWIPDGMSRTLFELEDGNWREHDFDPEDNIPEFSSVYVSEVEKAPDGNIWLATTGTGLFRIGQDDVAWYTVEDGLASNFVNDLLLDVDGSLWLATGAGISHYDGSTWQTFALSEGPGISYPMSAFKDSEGSVWFGAIDGVAKLGEDGTWQTFSNFTPQSDYLYLPKLTNITESSDEEVYGAGCAGVYKYGDEGWEILLEGPLAASEKEVFERIIIPWCVTQIAIADNDTIWVNQMDIPQDNAHGVLQISGDDYIWFSTPYITAILPRENGDVWFGTKEGVLIYAGDAWGQLPESVYGDYSWITAGMTGPDGAAWFGTPVGFARFDGEQWTNYELADGSEMDVFALTYDDEGIIWLSALEGIGRFDGEEMVFYEFGTDQVDPFSEISNPELIGTSMVGVGDSIAFGPDGALWMSFGPQGIIRFEVPSP